MERVQILNVLIDNLSIEELLVRLKSGIVVTPNIDHIIKLQKDPEFFEIYRQATYRVCDSQVLLYMAQSLGTPLKERISGSDLFPAFYKYHKDSENIHIFLLGGKEGVAKQAQININEKIGRPIIVGAHSPSFGFEKNEQECEKIVNIINQSGATVLAVGVGAPKQEKWIYKYKDRLPNVKIFLAIGATIDFEAGYILRSPKWMSRLGLEWLYRLSREPQRLWKRYLVEDPWFFLYALEQKLGLYQSPFEERTEQIDTAWLGDRDLPENNRHDENKSQDLETTKKKYRSSDNPI